jgi:hypothetical protein
VGQRVESPAPRIEPVLPEPSDITLGIDDAEGAYEIMAKLESVKNFEVDFDLMMHS